MNELRWRSGDGLFFCLDSEWSANFRLLLASDSGSDARDGRTWIVPSADALASDGFAERFRPSPTPSHPFGDSLTYTGEWSDDARRALEKLQPSRLCLPCSSDLSQVSEWTWIRHLQGPKNDAELAKVAGMHWLETLSLREAFDVTTEGMRHLAGLNALRELDLWGTRVGDEGLRHLVELPALQALNPIGHEFSDDGLPHLAQMGALERLDLRGARVSGEGLAHLVGAPSLRALNLRHIRLTDADLATLAALRSLKRLDLGRTAVSDAGVEAHLTKLSELKYLSLGHTRVGDTGLVHLSRLAKLRALDLPKTAVSNDGLAPLAELDELDMLHLGWTEVGDEGLRHLTGPMRDLRLNRTP
ncbi:MAG: hypothetical protein AAF645_29100, partial [Myxococcota bacterium]